MKNKFDIRPLIFDPENYPEDAKKQQLNDWNMMPCVSPSHNPPMHLFIPPGCSHTHVCPYCGQRTVLKSPIVF